MAKETKQLSLDEQMEQLQREFAAKKKKLLDKRNKRIVQIGESIVNVFPELIDYFDTEGFDIMEYVKGAEFLHHFSEMVRDNSSVSDSLKHESEE